MRDNLHCCMRCRSNLFASPVLSDVKKNVYAPVSDLLDYIAANPGSRFPTAGVSRVLQQLLNESWERGSEGELFRVLPRDECIRFAHEDESITLQSALRIAFWLHVPVSHLLLGRLEGTSRALLLTASEDLPRHISRAHRKRNCAAIDFAEQIEARLDGSDLVAPSLRQIARDLQVSVGALRYRHPELVNRAAQAYRTCRLEQRIQVDQNIQRTVAEAIRLKTFATGVVRSRKALLREILAGSNLPKNRVRRAISDTLLARAPSAVEGSAEAADHRMTRGSYRRNSGRKPS